MEKQLIPQGYFILNSDYGFVHISKTGSLTNGNTDLGSRNWVVSWRCQIVLEIIICIKNFFISKKKIILLKLDVKILVSNFKKFRKKNIFRLT